MLVSEWLALFRGVIKKGDYWVAHCPGHPDTHQSLSIREGDKQAVLLKCHAGCPNTAIVEAVGKKLKDLFNDPARGAGRRHLTTVKIVTSYDYYDEAGTLLYANVRFEPKDFKQRRPHPTLADTWLGGISAGWYAPGKSPFGWPRVSGADAGARPAEQPAAVHVEATRHVIYRLDELTVLRPKEVLVCEGEKDVDRAFSVGFQATTNAAGAGKWKTHGAEYAKQLKAVGVERAVLIPDNDAPGFRHMADVLASLVAIGIECRWLTLPGLSEKSDLSNWLDGEGACSCPQHS